MKHFASLLSGSGTHQLILIHVIADQASEAGAVVGNRFHSPLLRSFPDTSSPGRPCRISTGLTNRTDTTDNDDANAVTQGGEGIAWPYVIVDSHLKSAVVLLGTITRGSVQYQAHEIARHCAASSSLRQISSSGLPTTASQAAIADGAMATGLVSHLLFRYASGSASFRSTA